MRFLQKSTMVLGRMTDSYRQPYERAQEAMTQLKIAIHDLLCMSCANGLTNAEIGRQLGIYAGHKGHQGHVSRTLLSTMEIEGVVKQDPASRRWALAHQKSDENQGE